ncbi:MAG: ABC transporter permease [Pseudonocardia sp.]|nr:ABC transporter permease [Pseudonocardia sp.]
MNGKFLALAGTELRLLLRNKMVALSSLVMPLLLGLFWAFTMDPTDPRSAATVVALQLTVVLGMGVYATATLTVVARRRARVLTRMRTSGISDGALLAATVAPYVAIGAGQLVLFGVLDAVLGVPLPADPLPLVLAVLGGIAFCVLAGLATTIVTSTPERAQYTTMPLLFALLGTGIVLTVAPTEGAWRLLVAIPGAAIGDLTRFAFVGGTWDAGAVGLPLVLQAVLALVAWSAVFGVLARRRFRWDPRI